MTVHDYCPHCGAPTVDGEPAMSPSEKLLYRLLRARPGEWVNAERLETALYGGRDDGGPLSARNIVNVHIHAIRKKLGSGFIETKLTGGSGGRGSYRWVGGEKQDGKARSKEEAGSPTAERTVAAE